MQDELDATRRNLLLTSAVGFGTALLATGASAASGGAESPFGTTVPVDEGTTTQERVEFPPIQDASERPGGGPPNAEPPSRRVGFAIMGLGRLALENILPAFAQCKHARPVALVSGNAAKMRTVAAQHGIAESACYSYAEFSKIRGNPAIEVVYVVLPNSLHRDAVLQAAAAGKHVMCEKPMASTTEEARDMVEACRRADRKLMIAYRCQYEVNNVELARRARAGEFGQVQFIDAINTQNQGDPSQWRQRKKLAGGGSLPDVGLYCLNTSRALLGEEPIEVSAMISTPSNDVRFKDVESTVAFTLRFPSGIIANCASSYSAHEHRNLRVLGSSGTGEIDNAFSYEGQRLRLFRRDGKAESNVELALPRSNQFSLEIDHMAQCVRSGRQPRTPGEEGVQDHVVMAAIYEAAATGRAVKLARVQSTDAFRGPLPPSG